MDDNVKASAKLREFKNIKTALDVQAPLTIKYSCVKKMVWINKYECDPEKMNVQLVGETTFKK